LANSGRNKKLIYIAGGGHSGTTIIDLLISSSKEVFSIGEGKFYEKYIENDDGKRLCTCKEKFKDCSFWQEVRRNIEKKDIYPYSNSIFQQIKIMILTFFSPWFPKKSSNQGYDNIISSCFNAALDVKPKLKYILDSSKDPFYLFELCKNLNYEIIVIHIIRDARGYAYSYNNEERKRLKLDIKSNIRAVIEWIVLNLLIVRIIDRFAIKSYRTSYEEFCSNPQKFINKISSLLEINLDENFLKSIEGNDYHNLEGNNLRFSKVDQIIEDKKWIMKLSSTRKFFLGLISRPFYRYWVKI
tara:strand:+ start:201 stop:1097 length:897 start_codon:yes stop_codon:yes gene_type:complete